MPASSVCNSTVAPTGAQILGSLCVGSWPQYVVFDPANGLLYAASENSQNVSVVSSSTLQKVDTIPAANARGIALDPTNGRLFITNGLGSTVVVVDTTNDNTVLTTVNLTGYTDLVGAQYDPSDGLVFFLANNNADLVGMDPGTYAIAEVIPVDPNPGGGNGYAIDPSPQLIYFPSRGSDAVQVINQTTGQTETYISMAAAGSSYGPTSTFLDPYNGFIYTMLGGMLSDPGNLLYIFNPQTGTTVVRLAVGSWPNAYAYDPGDQLLYVACAASGTISVINVTTNELVDTIFLGTGTLPGALAVDPTTGDVFVGEDGTGMLVELPSAASSPSNALCQPTAAPDGIEFLGSLCIGIWPQTLVYDSASHLIYASSENSENVSIIDPNGPRVLGSILTDNWARGLALDPYTGLLYVSDGQGDNVAVINTTTNTIVGSFNLTGYTDLVGAQFDPTTDQLFFLANNPPDSILSVNASTDAISQVIPIPENPGGGSGPIAGVDTATHTMYFAERGNYGVEAIDELTGEDLNFFPTGSAFGPTNTFYDPSNHLLYVEDGGWLWLGPGDQVVVLNVTTGQQVATIPVGEFPSTFGYDPARHLLYVSCAASGTISVIDDRTNQVVGTISLGSTTLPGPVFVDPSGDLFVGEDGTGMLVELPPGPLANSSIGYWSPVPTSSGPSGRAGSAMVYDAAIGKVVLFGGCTSGSFFDQNCTATNDTWAYSGGVYTQLAPPVSPSPRVLPSMTYDAATQEVVLFGGLSGSPSAAALGDTWEFNGVTWTELFPRSSPPASGVNQAMSYDPSTGSVVLFASGVTTGSDGAPTAYLNETWAFSQGAWTELSNGTGPSPRGGESFGYDAATGSLLLFGGSPCGYFAETWGCSTLNDTWAYANGTWTEANISVAPPSRDFAAMAYDPQLNGTLLFGGQSGGAAFDDAWVFTNGSWSLVSSPLVPAPREGAGLAYDSADGTMVLFGGYLHLGRPGDSSQLYFADTWTFQLGTPPSGLSVVSMELSSGPTPVGSLALIVGDIQSATPVAYSFSGLPPGCAAFDSYLLVCSPLAAGVFTVILSVTNLFGARSSGSIVLYVGVTPVSSSPKSTGAPLASLVVSGAVGAVVGGLLVAAFAFARERARRRERREGEAIVRELEDSAERNRPTP